MGLFKGFCLFFFKVSSGFGRLFVGLEDQGTWQVSKVIRILVGHPAH